MNKITVKKSASFCCAIALSLLLLVTLNDPSIAATATANARLQIVASIMSMTIEQKTLPPVPLPKRCGHKFVSFYIGTKSDTSHQSQTSIQCTSIYEIPAPQGSIIIIP